MNEDIKIIYNKFWFMYKTFLADYDMAAYNNGLSELYETYKDNPAMLSFCQTIAIAWAPHINQLMEQHKGAA